MCSIRSNCLLLPAIVFVFRPCSKAVPAYRTAHKLTGGPCKTSSRLPTSTHARPYLAAEMLRLEDDPRSSSTSSFQEIVGNAKPPRTAFRPRSVRPRNPPLPYLLHPVTTSIRPELPNRCYESGKAFIVMTKRWWTWEKGGRLVTCGLWQEHSSGLGARRAVT